MQLEMLGWIDSLLMAAVMAMTGCPRDHRRQAIFGFMAFDFLASFAGWSLTAPRAIAVLFAFALSYAAIGAARKRPILNALVPVLCSVDNLFLGGVSGPFQFWPAAAEGVASGIAAWAGFRLGSLLLERMKGAVA